MSAFLITLTLVVLFFGFVLDNYDNQAPNQQGRVGRRRRSSWDLKSQPAGLASHKATTLSHWGRPLLLKLSSFWDLKVGLKEQYAHDV
jgi:hypothetical protein